MDSSIARKRTSKAELEAHLEKSQAVIAGLHALIDAIHEAGCGAPIRDVGEPVEAELQRCRDVLSSIKVSTDRSGRTHAELGLREPRTDEFTNPTRLRGGAQTLRHLIAGRLGYRPLYANGNWPPSTSASPASTPGDASAAALAAVPRLDDTTCQCSHDPADHCIDTAALAGQRFPCRLCACSAYDPPSARIMRRD